jgi:hypothetical protein
MKFTINFEADDDFAVFLRQVLLKENTSESPLSKMLGIVQQYLKNKSQDDTGDEVTEEEDSSMQATALQPKPIESAD